MDLLLFSRGITGNNDSYNPEQNTWNKLEKASKIGPDKKSLISTFAFFLTSIAKV